MAAGTQGARGFLRSLPKACGSIVFGWLGVTAFVFFFAFLHTFSILIGLLLLFFFDFFFAVSLSPKKKRCL